MKIKACIPVLVFCLSMFVQQSFAVSRLLEFNWAVDDTHSYSYTQDIDWELTSLSQYGTVHSTATLTYDVVQDNGDSSFDVDWSSSNVTRRIDSGNTENLSGGSDTQTITTGRGRAITDVALNLLIPGFNGDWNFGSRDSDQTGMFPATAVDVTDTWTQTITVTPYNQSAQNIDVTCELLEWTTLNGYNVAKIERTYERPISGNDSSQSVTGSLSVTEYIWFAYSEHLIVKVENTTSGTLSIDGNEFDITSTSVQTLN